MIEFLKACIIMGVKWAAHENKFCAPVRGYTHDGIYMYGNKHEMAKRVWEYTRIQNSQVVIVDRPIYWQVRNAEYIIVVNLRDLWFSLYKKI